MLTLPRKISKTRGSYKWDKKQINAAVSANAAVSFGDTSKINQFRNYTWNANKKGKLTRRCTRELRTGSKLKKSISPIWPKLCQKKVDMPVRTLPEQFCPKRFGCLATSAQKWREIENWRISHSLIAIVPFFNRCVSNAVNWVPRPKKRPLSNGTLSFLWKVSVFVLQAKISKVIEFLEAIFLRFIIFREHNEAK